MIDALVEVEDPHAHLYRVTLTVPAPAADQRVSLPVWIPGSYLVREFARHLSHLEASQGRRSVPLRQVDKATWQADCRGDAALVLRYRVYAFDPSVRAAFLDASRGFFNGTSLFLRAEGREDEPHRMTIGRLPRGWHVATAMTPERIDARGVGRYLAADYDELVDHPVELGTPWEGRFEAGGIPHRFVVWGALPDFDGHRLLEDTRRACEACLAFWRGGGPLARGGRRGRRVGDAAPFDRYLFLLNAVDDGYGGLEHRASTALIAGRRDLPRLAAAGGPPSGPGTERTTGPAPERNDAYLTLLGLVAHEYFHAWNVKRLRPREFTRLDYTRENHTELLWFFEGFTSYYDDLLLRRAGLIDPARYLQLLAKTVNQVHGGPGRRVQSVAQASFDAWTRYYRADENTPNSTVSYYAKGSLVALALDLTLRAHGPGSLDDVMRRLWANSGGGPVGESDISRALSEVAGRPMAATLQRFVHGTDDLPLQPLLAAAGVAWQAQPASVAQRLGLRVSESALTGVKVTHVLRDGVAEQCGFAAGDEWLAVDGWRLRRLDELPRFAPPRGTLRCLVARDQRVVELTMPVKALHASATKPAAPVVALAPQADASAAARAVREGWLGG